MKEICWIFFELRVFTSSGSTGGRRRRGDAKTIISPNTSFGDIIMGKWAKPDLSDLENDLLNNSIKSISWQLINIIPKTQYAKNKENLWPFLRKLSKVAKHPNLTFFWPFGPWKNTLEWFKLIQLLTTSGRSWEINLLSEKLTDGRRADRRQTNRH